MTKILKYTVISVVTAYVLFCLIVVICPQLFFYHPSDKKSDVKNAHQYDYLAQEVSYVSADGTQLQAWVTPAETGRKMIVFLHGNSHNIEEFYYKMKSFSHDGYGTFMPEYRGFGGIKGKITQKNLEDDAIAAIKFLNKHGYKNEDIYLYGMSLGSHMAIHTAYELQKDGKFAGVILEVPFDSLLNVVKKRVPFLPNSLIVRETYDNQEEIKSIKSPILIMGASDDKVVPVELAENLYQQAPQPKKMIVYKNAKHHNLFNFRNDLDIMSWMALNSWGELK